MIVYVQLFWSVVLS